MNVIIVGGGIGGLACAIALSERGIESRVYEQRRGASEEGAGIQIGPNGTRILKRLGLTRLLEEAISVPEAIRILDGRTGRPLARLPLGHWIAERHGAPYWTLHRRDLHAALRERADALGGTEIVEGIAVTAAATRGTRIVAGTATGPLAEASVLVAADGLWSRLRRGAEPVAVGKSAYRTVVAAGLLPPEAASDVHVWLMPGAHVVHYPIRRGSRVAMVAILDEVEATPEWSASVAPAAAAESFAALPQAARDVVAAGTDWRRWSLHTLDRSPAWVDGRVALLGDAAHPVLPFLAQGGVLALEDAVTLATCLAEVAPDIDEALARYAAKRQPRAERVAKASRTNGRIYHLSPVPAFVRNAGLRLSPPERLMRRYDWLYAFDAAARRA